MRNIIICYISFIWMFLVSIIGIILYLLINDSYKKADRMTTILLVILILSAVSFVIIFKLDYWPQSISLRG